MMDDGRAARKNAIIGFLIAGTVLIGLSIYATTHRNPPAAVAPEILVVGTVVVGTPPHGGVRFVTRAPLKTTPMGWMAGDLHLHALVDTTSLMAGSNLIRVAGDTLVWSFPSIPPGTHSIRLFWADPRHRPIGDSTRSIDLAPDGTEP
ncbi:MAG: hypothetical protein ABIS27_06640 [Longimicrobiales bacterium]